MKSFLKEDEKVKAVDSEKDLKKDSQVYHLIAVKLNKKNLKNAEEIRTFIDDLNTTFAEKKNSSQSSGVESGFWRRG